MEQYSSIGWFLFGAFVAVFLTRLLSITHAAFLVHEAIYDSLKMLAKMHEDLHFVRELKHKEMKKSGLNEEQITKFEEVDDKIIQGWKNTVIQNIILNSPPTFRKIIKFSNWKEAMEQLNSMYKKN